MRVSALVLALAVALAQTAELDAQVGLELQVGPTFPIGDYGDDTGSDAGFARIGVAGLVNIYGQIGTLPELEWLVTSGLTAHGVQDEYADLVLAVTGASDVSTGPYLGIPILAGLRYRAPLSDEASLHFGAGAGVYLVKGPTVEVDSDEIFYEWASKFGVAISVGLDFNRALGVGARVVPLGTVESEAEFSTGGSPVDVEQPVTYVDLFLSVRL